MKAIVFPEKDKAEIWDVEPPKITQPNEIKIRTLFTGVSTGTERHVMRGGPYSLGFPGMNGYQTIGVVEKIGSDVKEFSVGDIVFSDNSKPPESPKIFGWGFGQMETCVTSFNLTENIVKLDADADLEECALISVASVGLHTCIRGRISVGDKVLILGQGLIGNFAAQAARALGATVIGCDIDSWRLEMAKKYACDEVIGPEQEAIDEGIKKYGPFDVAMETTGAEGSMDTCLRAIKSSFHVPLEHGRIVAIAGRLTMKYENIVAQAKEAEIIHTGGHTRSDTLNVLRFLKQGKMQIKPLITHRIKLAEAPQFFQWILKSQEKLLGVVIDWRE